MVTRFALLLVAVAGCNHSKPTPYNPLSFANLAPLPAAQWVYLEGAVDVRRNDGAMRLPTPEERKMIHEGLELANTVLRSDCFQAGVVAARMTHTDNESPAEVYATMTRIPPVVLSYDLYDGTSAHGTVGYDDSAEPLTMHLNLYFVKNKFAVASTTLHEAAHARGFIHKSSREGSSVPYTMNYIFDQCARKSLPKPIGDGPDDEP